MKETLLEDNSHVSLRHLRRKDIEYELLSLNIL